MLLKNKNKYNEIYNKFIKRILSGVISLAIPLTYAGCSKKETEIHEEKSSISYSDSVNDKEKNKILDKNLKYMNDKNFFANKKSYYEYNDENLNNIIDQIKNIEYESNNEFFNNFDIYNTPTKEIIYILENYNYDDENKINSNYEWYKDGKIDKDILYNKILLNTEGKGIEINDNLKKLINCIIDVLPVTLESIKKFSPNLDFNIAFYNIDNLSVENMNDEYSVAYYVYYNNRIFVNFNYIDDYNNLKEVISHELGHLIMSKSKENYSILKNGFSIDDDCKERSPLDYRFLDEFIAEEISINSLNRYCDNFYVEEEEKINLLLKSVNKNKFDIMNCYIEGNQNKFMDMFECEFRDFNFVFSTLYALNLACGYEDLPDNKTDINGNDYTIRKEFNNYAKVQLVKNAYTRIFKSYYMEKIDKVEYENQIKSLKQLFLDSQFKYCSDNKYLEDIFNNLDNICSIKTKNRK